jgi:hydrogenase maturation protease
MSDTPRWLLAGVGNPGRSDDGIGAAVIAAVAPQLPSGVRIIYRLCEPARLLDELGCVEGAWLVDAASGGAAPGTITRLDLACGHLPALVRTGASSHGFGLAGALELARALGRLPDPCIVYAVEAGCFDHGVGLSAPLRDAVAEVARRLNAEFAALAALPERAGDA